MKGILQFVRTTLVGGIFFLLPVIVVVAIVGKALAITNKIVAPLATTCPATMARTWCTR